MPKTYTLDDFNIDGTLATREIIWEDPDGWDEVQERTAGDARRWCTIYSRVISNGTEFVRITWEEGNTEYQEGSDEVWFDVVRPVQKTITVYELVKE